ncbi:MAG: rhomboid family intramembrane serine protease [Desulfobacterales bacterium]|nr:rhomboid family intramembrane serine protease [Desulfobacterales bacterium]
MADQRRSILCPNCRMLISVSERRCPFCGLGSPGAGWRRMAPFRLFGDPALLVKTVIGANIAMYALALILDPRSLGLNANPLRLLSPSDQSVLVLGATGTIPIDRFQRWWTLLSANYLHGGLLHIFFNMAAFRQLGLLVIQEYGPSRMFLIFTLGGVGGFLVSYLAGVPLTIGASAGVCGLVGAVLYYGRSRGGVYGGAVYKQVGMWAIVMFVFGMIVPGINNWGHGGGLVAGALLGFLLGYHERKRESAFQKTLASICLVLTAAILGWAVATGIYYRFL